MRYIISLLILTLAFVFGLQLVPVGAVVSTVSAENTMRTPNYAIKKNILKRKIIVINRTLSNIDVLMETTQKKIEKLRSQGKLSISQKILRRLDLRKEEQKILLQTTIRELALLP